MSGAGGAQDKAELAQHIARWATHDLGFRKAATLVTARGEETICAADIEPLLQGELAQVLELAATQTVSAPIAEQKRRRLAAFCAQSRVDSEAGALGYVRLRRDLAALDSRRQELATAARNTETANRAAIQSIDEIEAKRRAAEERIYELRLQILKKQLAAEDARRQTGRMRLLVRDMSTAADAAKCPGVSPETASAVLAAAQKQDGAAAPREILARVTAALESLSAGQVSLSEA
ncbi:hypothetical protein IWQ57_000795 [Coemansia nantahalensis]|uniref:Uncharacterized protein n=1 Tax=Coemansia nantahalensis TaxID=2789366 RepID=A0ACC1K6X6_9FUNG|nr:hypothetical protein IWQ57_000795 [Coemansia nantahalensis]